MLSFLGFGPSVKTEIVLKNENFHIRDFGEGNQECIPAYANNATIEGFVKVTVDDDVDYSYLKIEFIGEMDHLYERGKNTKFVHVENFVNNSKSGEIKAPGQTYPFTFVDAIKQYESYEGYNVNIRYYVRFSCIRNFAADIIEDREIWVEHYTPTPEINSPIKMEVGIEDCLHLEFEYNQQKYHLDDAIVGKIFFLLTRIRLRFMELELIKREWSGAQNDSVIESERLTQFEIMDGSPVKGESVPVRIYLSPFRNKLTPTYNYPHMKFAVRYFLNIVLVDDDERRYFKQSEVILWRSDAEKPASFAEEWNAKKSSGDS